MRGQSIVLAIASEHDRVRMQSLLQGAGYTVTCIDQNRLSQTPLSPHVLLIADTTHEGTAVIDTITALLNTHRDLAVIFVLPKHTDAAPPWGAPFRDKQASFFACDHVNQALLSFVDTYAGRLASSWYSKTTGSS